MFFVIIGSTGPLWLFWKHCCILLVYLAAMEVLFPWQQRNFKINYWNESNLSLYLAHMFFVTIHMTDLPGCYESTVNRDKRKSIITDHNWFLLSLRNKSLFCWCMKPMLWFCWGIGFSDAKMLGLKIFHRLLQHLPLPLSSILNDRSLRTHTFRLAASQFSKINRPIFYWFQTVCSCKTQVTVKKNLSHRLRYDLVQLRETHAIQHHWKTVR